MNESAPPSSVLRQLVERAGSLYSLPNVAMRVLELTGGPQVDVAALKECLEHDPALVAKILRVVNSSLFGASRKITDLSQALALLGVKPLKLLVLGFSLPKELWAGLEAQMLARYWRRSLVKAVAARELSERVWLTPGDEAFIAGLLQDVGMLVLIQDLGESYTKFLDRVQGEREHLDTLEVAALGFDHAVLSARLLAHWSLPEPLVRAVGLPRRAERLLALPEVERQLPQTLHLAELVAGLLVDERPDALLELLEAGRQYRDLTLEQLTATIESLEAKVSELAGLLSLELPSGARYLDVISKAHDRLSEAAAEAALGMQCVRAAEASLWSETQSLQASLTLAAQPRDLCQPTPAKIQSAKGAPVDVSPDPGLSGTVAASIVACRAARKSLSLLLVELERYEELVMLRGREATEQLALRLKTVLGSICDPSDTRLYLGDGRFAVLLSGRDRSHAADVAREVFRRWPGPVSRGSALAAGVTLSAGLATSVLPPKNFPPQDIIDAAERCLSAARRSGGETLKSIEL